jgi:hypothetical protein
MGVEEGIDGHASPLGYDHGLPLDHLREVEPACIAQGFPSVRTATPFGSLSGTAMSAVEMLSVASLLDSLGNPKLVGLSRVDLPGAKKRRDMREVLPFRTVGQLHILLSRVGDLRGGARRTR